MTLTRYSDRQDTSEHHTGSRPLTIPRAEDIDLAKADNSRVNGRSRIFEGCQPAPPENQALPAPVHNTLQTGPLSSTS
jgi:hypothetical protein